MTLRGWRICLKVTLQTCAPENFCSRRWGAERRVSRAHSDKGWLTPSIQVWDFSVPMYKKSYLEFPPDTSSSQQVINAVLEDVN